MTISTGAGSTVAIATTYGASKTMSAISNASEAVATLEASHGIIVGDYFEVTSGWGRLNKRIVRAKAVATNDVTLELINTTSTTDFPAGTGTGSIREITAWTTISSIKQDSFQQSGGDLLYADATPLDSAVQQQIPTVRSPYTISFGVMDSSSGLTAAADVAETRAETAMRITSGSLVSVANGIWSVAEVPNISGTEVTTRKVDFTSVAIPKTY